MRTAAVLLLCVAPLFSQPRVALHDVYEASFQAKGTYANPYVELEAEARITPPSGAPRRIALFWNGGNEWKLRFSPDQPGRWSLAVTSSDAGLNGRRGTFVCTASKRPGPLRASSNSPGHFDRANGSPFWFMGDTAWGYFTDSPEDNHHRAQVEHYARTRAAQGFNFIHAMLLSEQGLGNQKGPPFFDLAAQKINPGYWQEADERLAYANAQGLIVGLALAWGDKRKVEPYAWRRFPDVEARKRYARYIAARYSAYNVYFLVSGEWHGELRTREGAAEDEVFREFVSIGESLAASDPHRRMIGIHPMSRHGSVREFAAASWMSFADYQQNYRDLHARVLASRFPRGPVVNSEYGYLLRDQDGDGTPDKDNSFTTEDMRFASWDIVLAGGYLVTGFGTTYFAGHRDPGPFDVDAAKNDDWEAQCGYIRRFFAGISWWALNPADAMLTSREPREGDRTLVIEGARRVTIVRPPARTYWMLADAGETYVVYARGLRNSIRVDFAARARRYRARLLDPRTGEFTALGEIGPIAEHAWQPPDEQDWVLLLEAAR